MMQTENRSAEMNAMAGEMPEIGSIVEGKVTGITKFGAFVALGGGKSGMVHISEISEGFVRDIRDFLQENQQVKAKFLRDIVAQALERL